jgi:hypothetical protein
LLPNDLIIVRNHGDNDEDEQDIKRALERQEDAHIKMEIQSNLKFQSLTLSPLRVQDHLGVKLIGCIQNRIWTFYIST